MSCGIIRFVGMRITEGLLILLLKYHCHTKGRSFGRGTSSVTTLATSRQVIVRVIVDWTCGRRLYVWSLVVDCTCGRRLYMWS